MWWWRFGGGCVCRMLGWRIERELERQGRVASGRAGVQCLVELIQNLLLCLTLQLPMVFFRLFASSFTVQL
jgi:hypothetical protein